MPTDVLKKKKYLIGFDPKLFTKKTLNFFLDKKKFNLKPINYNLVDKIWKRKIKKNNKKFYSLPNGSTGENYKFKIAKILANLKNVTQTFNLFLLVKIMHGYLI